MFSMLRTNGDQHRPNVQELLHPLSTSQILGCNGPPIHLSLARDLRTETLKDPVNKLPLLGPASRRDHFGESVTEEEMKDYVWLRPELIVQVEFSDEGWRREADSNARFRFTV